MSTSQTYSRFRYFLVFGILFLLGAAITGRLFLLQIKNGDYYSALSQGQHKTLEDVTPRRGDIVFQTRDIDGGKFYSVATDKEWQGLYFVPSKITDKERVLEVFKELFEMEDEALQALEIKISKEDDPYEPFKERVDDEIIEKINLENLSGVEVSRNRLRFYPYDELASHVLGFMGYVGEEFSGRYGVEEYYNEELSGSSGVVEVERGLGASAIVFVKNFLTPVKDGSSIVLTIDYNIQSKAEEILSRYVKKWDADGGSVLIAEPTTGRILAMVSRPGFDLNHFNEVEDINVFLNPITQKLFEPGSIFKPFTMAAALNEGVIGPETTYFDKGEVTIGKYTIKNSDLKSYETQTMTQILEKSLNTGVIFVEELLGQEKFKSYIEDFGFSEKTGIDLPAELRGDISNLSTGRDINYATASFGQGIAVTPIQLITAFGAIANQGTMMKPYIVDSIINSNGETTYRTPQEIRDVFSSQTSSRLTAMLVSAVKNGYGEKGGVERYLVAGKTGTAQVPKEDGAGYSEKTIHSFIGFAPAFNPRFIAMVKLDNPKGIRFSSDSIAPAFGELAKYILTYYEVPPQ